MNTPPVRVAAAQYPIGFFHSWSAYETHLEHWVTEAVKHQAQLLVFPEYFSIEISSIFGDKVFTSLELTLQRLSHTLGDFLTVFRRLARDFQVHICAGSYPVHEDDRYINRSYFFWPSGHCEFQEKLQMTRFERERWHVSGGAGLNVFQTDFGRVAINICYDSEFPLLARNQVDNGAQILLVPSCTDTLAGFNRVKIGCQARALENQCYVVQSPTIGECKWSEAVDMNFGVAAVYTPVDRGFPDNGVLTAGRLHQPQWVYADLDLEALDRVRAEGQVFNHRDWDGQYRHVRHTD